MIKFRRQEKSNTEMPYARPSSEPTKVLGIRILDPGMPLPRRFHANDVGLDLSAAEDVVLSFQDGVPRRIRTGIAVAVPKGYAALVMGRSGRTCDGLIVHPGLVDPGYRGEIQVMASSTRWAYHVRRGDRIAQLVLLQAPILPVMEADELPPGDRGEAGFGSTDKFPTSTSSQRTFEEAASEIMRSCLNVLVRRYHDYGPDNIAVYGERGILVRVTDKVSRLKNLLWGDKQPQSEPVEDSWVDLVNYGIIALMWRNGMWGLPLGKGER